MDNINFANNEEVKKIINTLEDGIYSLKTGDEDGYMSVSQYKGLTVRIFQSNGYDRVTNYDEHGYFEDEYFEKSR